MMGELDDTIEALESGRRCKVCRGDGVAVYGDTSCGRGGAGGQTITAAECHRCKGQGWIDAVDRHALAAQLRSLQSQLSEARQENERLRKQLSFLAEKSAAFSDESKQARGALTPQRVDRWAREFRISVSNRWVHLAAIDGATDE